MEPVEPQDRRLPRFLIMDNTPLSLLATIEALDWLFEPGCEVMITDMVMEEAIREPGEGRDRRRGARACIAGWLEQNRTRITIFRTMEGERYARDMRLWDLAGKPAELRPDWSNRGSAVCFPQFRTSRPPLRKTRTSSSSWMTGTAATP